MCHFQSCCFNFGNCKYQGIPEQAEAPPAAQVPVSEQAPATQPRQQPAQPTTAPAGGPNANPLDLFPQVVVMYITIDQLCKIFWVVDSKSYVFSPQRAFPTLVQGLLKQELLIF